MKRSLNWIYFKISDVVIFGGVIGRFKSFVFFLGLSAIPNAIFTVDGLDVWCFSFLIDAELLIHVVTNSGDTNK